MDDDMKSEVLELKARLKMTEERLASLQELLIREGVLRRSDLE